MIKFLVDTFSILGAIIFYMCAVSLSLFMLGFTLGLVDSFWARLISISL